MVDCATRDHRDFEAVFVRHFSGLVRALTVVCGDRETAADCVQEAFARAHERWDRLEGYEDPVGWIRHVAINLARDAHRRSRRGQLAHERLAASEGARVSHDQPADPLCPKCHQGHMQKIQNAFFPKRSQLRLLARPRLLLRGSGKNALN